MHAVKLACQRPDTAGRSLSQWDCAEIRRQLLACLTPFDTHSLESSLRSLAKDPSQAKGLRVAALALITLVPDLVLFLPRLLGYKG